jgi:hypothetical protein
MKWEKIINKIAGNIVDLHASTHSVERTWEISRQVVSRLQYLGFQDAPQRRRPRIHTPGTWNGSVFKTTHMEVLQSVAQTKWDQAKAQIKEGLAMIATLPDRLVSYKQLKEIRGFLGHISMTYSMVTPYLKGFHLMLASHHPGQDKFSWKMASKEWAAD